MTTTADDGELYIAYTPLQVLLCYAVAYGNEVGTRQLYVIPAVETDSTSRLSDLVSETGVFDIVNQLPGKFDGKQKRPPKEQRRASHNNISFLTNVLEESDVNRVYASVDTKEVVQAVMKRAPRGVYIEDGGNAYGSNKTGWHSYRGPVINKILYRIKHGFWWENIDVYGTSTGIDEVRVIYPSLRRPELQKKPSGQIPKLPLYELVDDEGFKQYLQAYGLSRTTFSDIDGVLLVAASEMIERYPEYGRIIEHVAEQIEASQKNFAVKFHPRSPGVEDYPDIVVETMEQIPSGIPMELVYSLHRADISYVIGGRSTAVYTADWLCENPEIVSLGRFFDEGYRRIFDVFQELGIQVVESEEELDTLFC